VRWSPHPRYSIPNPQFNSIQHCPIPLPTITIYLLYFNLTPNSYTYRPAPLLPFLPNLFASVPPLLRPFRILSPTRCSGYSACFRIDLQQASRFDFFANFFSTCKPPSLLKPPVLPVIPSLPQLTFLPSFTPSTIFF